MDYGKRIKLTFDRPVSHVANAELPRWVLKNAYAEIINPIAISYGESQNIVNLDFVDFNNIVEPATLECLGCIAMGSPDLPFDPFSMPVYLKNLYPIPSDNEYLFISDVSISGEIVIAFDGKLYGDEYIEIGSVSISGQNILLVYKNGYVDNGYIQISSVSISGQYCDINGIPL